MYFGYNSSALSKSVSQTQLLSKSQQSLLTEPQTISLQREVDTYTRKLEQEKRRLYQIEENWDIIRKEFNERKSKIQSLKKVMQKDSQKKRLNSEVKNISNEIEQSISKLNQTLALNEQLKEEINKLRKERTNALKITDKLKDEIQTNNSETQNLVHNIEQRMDKTEVTKSQIIQIHTQNETDQKKYIKKFDSIKKLALDEKREREANKLLSRKEKENPQIDIPTILKYRLKKLIANNKEKVKVIDLYLKNMKIIDEAFNQIREGSGITDIEEITNTFIKSEEQNYSLYNYVNILNQDIENLQDTNTDLEKKCKEQDDENDIRRKQLQGTPKEEQTRKKYNKLIEEKQKSIDQFQEILKQIKPDLQQSLKDLANAYSKNLQQEKDKLFNYELGFDLTINKAEQYLSDLELYINYFIDYKNATAQNNNSSIINHTLMIDEIPKKENKQQKQLIQANREEEMPTDSNQLLDYKEFKDQALEILDKKKKKQQQ